MTVFSNENTISFSADKVAQLQDKALIKSWLHGKSKKTIQAYNRIAQDLLVNLHPKSLKHADLQFLQNFVNLLKARKPETIKQRIAATRSLFCFAHKCGYLPTNPAAFLPQVKSKQKLAERYLEEEEVLRMIHLTQNLRNRTVLKVLYSSGVRISELCKLKWKDITAREDGQGQLQIEQGKGDQLRVVVVSQSTYSDLISLKRPTSYSHEFVFQSQMSDKLSENRVREIVTEARLRAGIIRKVSPHWLRHCHASHALNHGAPISLVQSTLGHSSVSTTGKYLHARPGESSGKYLGI